jgi:hypothetical protein
VDARRVGIRSLFEWAAAALGVLALIWIVSVPVQRLLGPNGQAAIDDGDIGSETPRGIPAGATIVPVMLMLDGREIRQGDLRTKLDEILPAKYADGPTETSQAHFGERHARRYIVNGVRFYVVCERIEPNGQMKVSGIYLP